MEFNLPSDLFEPNKYLTYHNKNEFFNLKPDLKIRKYPELLEDVVSLETLKKYPLIAMDPDTVARRSMDNFLGSLGVDLQPSIEIGSWDLMKRLAVRGMGIGVIPREYVESNLADGTLYEIKTDPDLLARSVGMLLPKHASLSYALRCFLDCIFKEE